VANVGDSRCILARKKKREEDMSAIEVVPMSEDHRRPPRQEVGHQFSECVPRLRRLQLQVER
jgi:serine/threonine protein phosphatase PrpC